MSNNINNTSPREFDPNDWIPVSEASYAAGLYQANFKWLTRCRWESLGADDQARRTSMGFQIASAASARLDRAAAQTVVEFEEPEMWWAETPIGRRVFFGLAHLEAACDRAVQHGQLADGWLYLEMATALFGFGRWLTTQPPGIGEAALVPPGPQEGTAADLVSGPPPTGSSSVPTLLTSSEVRILLNVSGDRVDRLVADYYEASSDAALYLCMEHAERCATAQGLDAAGVDGMWLIRNGASPLDCEATIDVSVELTARLHARISRAIYEDDIEQLLQLLPAAVGALLMVDELLPPGSPWRGEGEEPLDPVDQE